MVDRSFSLGGEREIRTPGVVLATHRFSRAAPSTTQTSLRQFYSNRGGVYNEIMEDSIFTKIIKGEIPCHKIYEDDATLAFLDIHPIQPGNVLVVPKKQVAFIWDMKSDDYQHLMATVQKIGLRIRKVFPEATRVGVMIEGLDVTDHAHVKIFPFSTAKEYRQSPDANVPPDHATLASIAEKLRFDD